MLTVKSALWFLLHWIPWILPIHKMSLLTIFNGVWQHCGPGKNCKVGKVYLWRSLLIMNCMFASSPSLYLEILAPQCDGAWRWAFRMWLGHEGGALVNAISAFTRRGKRASWLSLPCEDTVERWPFMKQGMGALIRHWICWWLHLGLPASKTVRNKYSWFKQPSLW